MLKNHQDTKAPRIGSDTLQEVYLTGNVTVDSFERILSQLNHLSASEDPIVTLNLSRLTFLDPYGMATLCLVAKNLWQQNFIIYLVPPPSSSSITYYLERMNFYQSIAKWAQLEDKPPPRSEFWKKESDILLEMTPIASLKEIVQKIESRVYRILESKLGYQENDLMAFTRVVSELSSNVLDHSLDEDGGFVTAQTYQSKMGSRKGKSFVVISVGDLGIGIKKSLSARYPLPSHAQAIMNALKREYSRDPTRGLGLYIVKKIGHEYNGQFHLRSGDARICVKNRRILHYPTPLFPGTQISIALWQL